MHSVNGFCNYYATGINNVYSYAMPQLYDIMNIANKYKVNLSHNEKDEFYIKLIIFDYSLTETLGSKLKALYDEMINLCGNYQIPWKNITMNQSSTCIYN
jgi:hypothetical protein